MVGPRIPTRVFAIFLAGNRELGVAMEVVPIAFGDDHDLPAAMAMLAGLALRREILLVDIRTHTG